MNSLTEYSYLLISAGVSLGFVLVSLLGAHYLGPRQKKGNTVENQNFECGVESVGNARSPYSIKYFLTAVLFVLFDIEIIFFYPYAVNFKDLGFDGFLAVMAFVAIFFAGFIYVLKRGVLDWNK